MQHRHDGEPAASVPEGPQTAAGAPAPFISPDGRRRLRTFGDRARQALLDHCPDRAEQLLRDHLLGNCTNILDVQARNAGLFGHRRCSSGSAARTPRTRSTKRLRRSASSSVERPFHSSATPLTASRISSSLTGSAAVFQLTPDRDPEVAELLEVVPHSIGVRRLDTIGAQQCSAEAETVTRRAIDIGDRGDAVARKIKRLRNNAIWSRLSANP
jgi:hypothetical protein